MSRISAFKNKIKKLKEINSNLENKESLKYVAAKEKEIIELKQDLQCKQVEIDSLEWNIDRAEKRIKSVTEVIVEQGNYIKSLEDKKIKNRLKKLLAG